MLCDDCHKNESSIHFSQIVNNKKTDMNLCQACAGKRGFNEHAQGSDVGVGNLVSKIAAEYESEQGAASCPRCRLKYADFKKNGRLGCGHCYEAFEVRLHDLIRKIHGSDTHKGKVPKSMEPVVAKSRNIENMRKALRDAIQAEDFEKAAQIRDTVRKLEGAEK
ncbi:MAG: UvrB/UvrC motif-containing protein [Fibrobacteres bacterium]|nr:UvrB/UvrC motif-containing protein [Fibrobacterota bacterium]